MIRAVIFDIDNTMYNFDRAHAAAMEALFRYGNQALSLEPGSMKEGLSAAQKLILDRLGTNSSAIHNRLIRFQTFLESMKNVDLTKALEMYHTYWDTLLAVMEPEPGLKDLILDLGSRGIRIGIGSDMTAYIQFKSWRSWACWISFPLSLQAKRQERKSRRRSFSGSVWRRPDVRQRNVFLSETA